MARVVGRPLLRLPSSDEYLVLRDLALRGNAPQRQGVHIHDTFLPQMIKMLEGLGRWLDEGVEYAGTREFEPDRLLSQRLYPDQFSLVQQIQSACDSAKFAAARLADKEPPSHPDEEKTVAEIRERLSSTIDYLRSFGRSDFDDCEDRLIKMGFLPEDKRVPAPNYLVEFAMPNFYFHVTTAYAILRHNGVKLGKRGYIGSMKLVDA